MAEPLELLELSRKAHDWINTMQISGLGEDVAITVLANACIERVARNNGAAGAAHWLRNLASLVDQNGDAIETLAKQH